MEVVRINSVVLRLHPICTTLEKVKIAMLLRFALSRKVFTIVAVRWVLVSAVLPFATKSPVNGCRLLTL